LNVVKEFPPEHHRLVSFIDQQLANPDKNAVLDGIDVKPFQAINVFKNSETCQWEIPGSPNKIALQIHFYKGCINEIFLLNEGNGSFVARKNKLADMKK